MSMVAMEPRTFGRKYPLSEMKLHWMNEYEMKTDGSGDPNYLGISRISRRYTYIGPIGGIGSVRMNESIISISPLSPQLYPYQTP